MHFHCEVWFPERPENVEAAVTEAMDPFCEEGNERGWWDWWQVGGRWTGQHQPGYDPDKDESKKEKCRLCHGTGKRKDMLVANGCNGCNGTGVSVAWPTQWKPLESDVCSVENVPEDMTCYRLVVCKNADDIEAYEDEGTPVRQKLEELGCKGGWLVTVDYHC